MTLYVILTHSGKPVFYSSGTEEEITRYTAVIQAIVACFGPQDELRVVESDSVLIAVQNAFPLILVAIDHEKHSVHQLRSHLELSYAQILSVLTKRQLEKQYTSKPGIDLRPMLGGTEVFLKALVTNMGQSEPWTWSGALESLELKWSARSKLNAALLDARQQSSLLYGLVVSDGKFIGVVRPKQHSLHPPDSHLVFSMSFNTTVFSEGENWVPICFPRFNPNGFLYAYIRLISPPCTYLILVSADKHGFFEMQKVGEAFMAKLDSSSVAAIDSSTKKGRIDIKKDAHAEPIESFVYKSRSHVQFIQSERADDDAASTSSLKFAQSQATMAAQRLRICWFKCTEGYSISGWHTPAFESYCYANTEDKEEISHSVKKLVAWIRKHETKLFIVDGATF